MTNTYITAAFTLGLLAFLGLALWLFLQRSRLRILIKTLQEEEGERKDA
ncbi:MAG: hypothetical protein HYW48_01635 [Deltaproteobacteria bacterium]|nr:hypothetical protein [Deltaproteobacteria bacterium]